MQLTDQTVAAIGRMTVAATELEHVLAWIGADQAAGDAGAVFARAGEPARAALGSAQFAPPAVRDDLIAYVTTAADLLSRARITLHRLWSDNGPDRGPVAFNEVTALLLSCRDRLAAMAATAANS
jgi:hypothetical protein